MKKLLPFIILFILAMLIWDATFDPYHLSFDFDEGDFDNPVGALIAAALAGGGLLIGLVVMIVVGIVLAVVFAGVGVVLCGALLLVVAIAGLVLVPVMFPILIPVAIIWYLMTRDRNRRQTLKDGTPA